MNIDMRYFLGLLDDEDFESAPSSGEISEEKLKARRKFRNLFKNANKSSDFKPYRKQKSDLDAHEIKPMDAVQFHSPQKKKKYDELEENIQSPLSIIKENPIEAKQSVVELIDEERANLKKKQSLGWKLDDDVIHDMSSNRVSSVLIVRLQLR